MKAQSKNGASQPRNTVRKSMSRPLVKVRRKSPRIPVRWKWHYQTLGAIRDRLTANWHERLRGAAAPGESQYVDSAEAAAGDTDRELALIELTREHLQLHEVEAALKRIEAGTYGLCEATGRPIPAARLKAIPWTRFCKEAELRIENAARAVRPATVRPFQLEAE